MDDRDKTTDQLIAELELLREEVTALKQIGQTHLQSTTPAAENLTIRPSLHLADRVEVTGKYTILLIEDSAIARSTYRRFLMEDRDRTYEIIEFDNGTDALQWCQKNIPDIFLLDYFLPDMEGLELLHQLQQQTGRDTLPVIMLTGRGNIQIAVDLLKSGAQDYLDKSQITPEILHRSISYILQHNQLIREREWQQQQQQLLAKTALSIRESLKLEDILNTTVREVRNILQCDRVIIFQFSPDWGGTVLVESVADSSMAILPLHIYDPCIGEEYVEPFKQGLITAKSDIYNSDISPCHIEFLASLQVRANLVVPIIKGDELWGLLAVHHCTAPRDWQSSEIEFLRQLSAQVSIAIQQADLFEQVQKEALRIQTLFNTSFDGIIILDEQGKVLDVNPRFAQMQGYTPEETANFNLFDWDAHFTYEELRDYITIESGVFETRHRRKDDSIYDVEISISVVEWQGEILRFCVCRDITERKQAQLALKQLNTELEQRVIERTVKLTQVNDHLLVVLREKEHAYQLVKEQVQLLDLAHDSIITWDLNSVITFWNQGAESMYGWTKAEALGQEVHNFLKTEFPQPLAEIKAQLLEKGYWEGELIHYTWNDYPITVSSRWVLQKNDAGRLIKILEINNDITDRKQSELALQQYINEVEDLYNNAPCGYHCLDAEGTIVRINDTELNWLGYTRNELLYKKKFWELMPPENKQFFSQKFLQFKQQGWLENLELEVLNKDGSTRWLNLNAIVIKDEAGNFMMSRSSVFDISDRKGFERDQQQAELALQESEEQRRLALDLTHIGFSDTDLLTGKMIVNDNYFTLLGLVPGASEPIYQLWRSRVHPEDIEEVEGLYFDSLQARIDYEAEYRVVHPDGSIHWLMGRGKAIYDESGQPMRSLGVLLDISDRKQAEESLRQSESTLRSFFNSASMMMGIVEIYPNDIFHLSSNISTTQFFGTTPDGMQNRFASEIGVPQVLIEMWLNYYRETERTGAPLKFQYKHQIANIPKWLSVTTCFIDNSPSGRPRFSFIIEDITDRKQAEQMLELQAAIARNMAEGICLVRADNGIIVHANPKFEQMFGYDCGELNNQDFSILNYATDSVTAEDVTQAILSAVLHSGEATYQVNNVKKDGTPFWCYVTCSVFKHPDYGEILLAVQQDITDRKQAEAALLQKSRQEHLLWSITQAIRQSLALNAILHTAVTEVRLTLQTDRVAVYHFNPDWSGDFVVESVGEDWVKLVESGVCNVWEDTYLQNTQGGRFRNNESFVVNDIYRAGLQTCHIELMEQFQAKSYGIFPIFSGETLWGLLAIYENATPRQWQSWEIELLEQIASQLSIAIQQSELYEQLQLELQERKQAEAVLREAERRWRFLLDNVQLIVVGFDKTAAVNYVNPCFLKLTGYTESEALGKNLFETFILPSARQEMKTIFSAILRANAHPYYQNWIVTKSGEERFIAWNNTLLQDSEGNIIGTISIGEDITERQKIEKIKDEFIGVVSHELRTPLTAISMSLGLIKTGIYDKKPEKARRMIEIALLDTNRLVHLVNDILDLERLESGRAVLEKTVCKAADLMQQAIERIQAIATLEQLTLTFTPTDAEVWAAPDTIIQTLTNLLSNAIKFSPPQSTIHLSAEIQTDFVLFQVRDRGRGIPADKLELIFARFQQVDASDSREKGGTGLGLAICRSIIERHGGKIWAESSLGTGSTFFFTLPLAWENLV